MDAEGKELRADNGAESLELIQEVLERLFDGAPEALVVTSAAGRVLRVNPCFTDLFQYTPEEAVGELVDSLIVPKGYEEEALEITTEVGRGRKVEAEGIRRRKDGFLLNVSIFAAPVPTRNGQTAAYVMYRDLTEQTRTRLHMRKLARAVEQSPAAILITDEQGRIEYVNPSFEAMTGYACDEVLGRDPRFLGSGYMTDEEYDELWLTIRDGEEWRREILLKRKNHELFWAEITVGPIRASDGTITHYVVTTEDLTVQKEYEQRLQHESRYDALTGLPNRVLALDRLSQALRAGQRKGKLTAVLATGIERLSIVNGTLGHPVGDQLLVEAGHRLKGCVREDDTVTRFSGTEFVIIVSELDEWDRLERIAQRTVDAFLAPFSLDGQELHLTVNVGISVSPNDGKEEHVLLRNADAAMHQARAVGPNVYRFFTPEMNSAAMARLRMESLLRGALRGEELRLHYQPVVNLHTGAVDVVEVLARWNSPELGLVPPARFIPLAEEAGLILEIGAWVLKEAAREATHWASLAREPVRLSVNVSSKQLRRKGLSAEICQILSVAGFPPDRLELEMTESLLVDQHPDVLDNLNELREVGVRIALDDFGTGYSSLGYLKRFPFDTIKIDRMFVREFNRTRQDMALVRAMIAMAHGVGLEVVAEGVETQEQLEFLRAEGCDLAQGFHISEPLPAERFRAFLAGERKWKAAG